MYRSFCVACLEPTGFYLTHLAERPWRKHYCRACWKEVQDLEVTGSRATLPFPRGEKA